MAVPSGTLEQSTTEDILEGNAGVALESEGLTWKALLASVTYAMTLHFVQLTAFAILRSRFKRIYRPRTYLLRGRECMQIPPDGAFSWIRPVWTTSDDEVIEKCGLDAFLFLRYMRMMLRIFLPVTLVVIPTLAPINRLSGGTGPVQSLDELSISNVAPEYASTRLWAHWALATFVVGWVCYVVHDETLSYIKLRQRHLRSSGNMSRVAANTILVGNIPKALLTNDNLQKVFDIFPGGVKSVHINTDVKLLSSKLSTREDVVNEIEVAETKLITVCVVRSTKLSSDTDFRARSSPSELPYTGTLSSVGKRRDVYEAWERFIERREREVVRLPLLDRCWFPALPLLGKKVDRICHLRQKLNILNREIETLQREAETCPPIGSAFIQFNRRVAAHLACQSVIHGTPYRMAPRMLDVDPNDIVWTNLALDWRQRWARACISLAASASVIVLYAVPIAFTSLLANLDTLAASLDWLSWVATWPDLVKSLIQGVLPPALLQILLILAPTVFRGLVHFQGAPTGTAREVGVQNWHFVFLFVQVFLVVSMSGGLVSFLSGAADDPKSVPAELARSLPRAANYFMSYVLVKALTGSAGALLQPYTLFIYWISPVLDISPRQIWQRQAKLASMEWARTFPPLTNIAVIGIAFSVIAPLVLAFVSFAFALYWFAHRYNVIYVYQYELESGGRFFAAAINQLFAGLYVMELCMIGIFILAAGPSGRPSCIPQALAMISVLALTVAYQSFLNRTYEALIFYLPIVEEEQLPKRRTDSEHRDDTASCATQRESEMVSNVGRTEDVFIENSGNRQTKHTDDRGVCSKNRAFSEGRDEADVRLRLKAGILSPTVWIPQDLLGISRDEIKTTSSMAPNVSMSDRGASVDEKGKVTIETLPPEQESLTEIDSGYS